MTYKVIETTDNGDDREIYNGVTEKEAIEFILDEIGDLVFRQTLNTFVVQIPNIDGINIVTYKYVKE